MLVRYSFAMPTPVSQYAEHDLSPASRVTSSLDPSAALGIFRGVVDDVPQYLRDACEIAPDPQRLGGQRQGHRMTEIVDGRLAGLHRRGDDFGHVDRLDLEIDLAPCDARKVKEVVDKAYELPQLAMDDIARPSRARGSPSVCRSRWSARCGSGPADCATRARASR